MELGNSSASGERTTISWYGEKQSRSSIETKAKQLGGAAGAVSTASQISGLGSKRGGDVKKVSRRRPIPILLPEDERKSEELLIEVKVAVFAFTVILCIAVVMYIEYLRPAALKEETVGGADDNSSSMVLPYTSD